MEGDTIKGVITESKAGRQAILAKRVIDATGDADIAFRAGAPYRKDPKEALQPVSVSFGASGVDVKRLLEFARANPEHQYIGASIIGRDPSPFLNYIIINRGADDGLRRGMPVVTQNGLAGRVVQVTASAARVSLITDPITRINVRVEPSRSAAVLTGSITGDITLEQIPQDADVNPGNLILTSGLGGNYPANIIVGQVTSVRSRENALFQSASVQPVTDFTDLSIVLVITNFEPVDFSPLIPESSTP
jgi:rod shape-determining protein MreC